jgi:hypothetical protein
MFLCTKSNLGNLQPHLAHETTLGESPTLSCSKEFPVISSTSQTGTRHPSHIKVTDGHAMAHGVSHLIAQAWVHAQVSTWDL